MIFPVTDKIRLVGTAREWQLQRVEVRKEKVTWSSFKYYTSLASAISAMGMYDVRIATDVDDLVQRVHRLGLVVSEMETALNTALISLAGDSFSKGEAKKALNS